MNVLETLLNRRWILKSRDRELYYQVRDELDSVKKFLTEKVGYQVIVNPYLIRVEKIPALDGNPPVSGSAAICVFMPDLKLSGSAGGGRSVCFVAADGFCAGTVPGGAD